MAQIVISWDTQARNSFKKQLKHIATDSIQSAEKVRLDILKIIDGLIENPSMFPPDKFRKDNDGNFRAFEKNSLRVAYYESPSSIRILRVRHVKQEPKLY